MNALPDFALVLNTARQLEPPFSRWLPDQGKAIRELIREKAGQMSARIMVYGVYNAGKSTLLNALIGAEQAPMGDIPKTDAIAPYAWQGYTLLDSPGIDAPIAHEQITQTSLDRCDVVLFVISTGGSAAEARTWQDIVRLAGGGRRLMLVVNDRQGIMQDEKQLLELVDGMRTRMQLAAAEARQPHILQNIPIRFVNARSALKGRLEGKKALIKASGILELEQDMAEFLRACDSFTVLNACQGTLMQAVDEAECRLQHEVGTSGTQALTEVRARVEHERGRLTQALEDHLRPLLLNARRKAHLVFAEALDADSDAAVQARLESGTDGIVEWLSGQLNREVESEVTRTGKRLADLSELAVPCAGPVNPGIGDLPPPDPAVQPFSLSGAMAREVIGKMPIGDLTENGVQAALKLGKQQFPGLFRGIGAKTIGRYAEVAGRYAGPALNVVFFLWDLYQARKSESEARMRAERREQAIDDAAQDFVGELQAGYQCLLAQMIEDVFAPVESWLSKTQAGQSQLQDTVEADLRAFRQARIAMRAAGRISGAG